MVQKLSRIIYTPGGVRRKTVVAFWTIAFINPTYTRGEARIQQLACWVNRFRWRIVFRAIRHGGVFVKDCLGQLVVSNRSSTQVGSAQICIGKVSLGPKGCAHGGLECVNLAQVGPGQIGLS